MKTAESNVSFLEQNQPEHFDQVLDFEFLYMIAEMAIEEVESPVKQFEFTQRLSTARQVYEARLSGFVQAVVTAEKGVALLNALEDFWTTDRSLLAVYEYLRDINKDRLEDVFDVQELIIEAAPQTEKELAVALAVVQAAKTRDLAAFKATLIEYIEYFERIPLEEELEEITKGYMQLILVAEEGPRSEPWTVKELQELFDISNSFIFTNIAELAFDTANRKGLNLARSLLPYLPGEFDKVALAEVMAEMDLRIQVFEAENTEELYYRLEKIQIKYVKIPLLEAYLEKLPTLLPPLEDSFWPDAVTLETIEFDFAEYLRYIVAGWDFTIQASGIDSVNFEYLQSILAVIDGIETDTDLASVKQLLEVLDEAMPMGIGGEEIDFDLSDPALDFQWDERREFYRAAIAAADIDTVEDVKDAIKTGNAAFFAQFKEFAAEPAAYNMHRDDGITFTIKALDKKGNPCSEFDGITADVIVEIGHRQEVVSGTFAGGTLAVKATGFTLSEIGDYEAELEIDVEGLRQLLFTAVKVSAEPQRALVLTDALEYTAGALVQISAVMLYDEEDDTKILTTENGRYSAVISMGDDGSVNRLLQFDGGIAEVVLPVAKAQEFSVEIEIADFPLAQSKPIKVKHGAPAQLAVEAEEQGRGDRRRTESVLLTVLDAAGNTVLDFEGLKVAQFTVVDDGLHAAGNPNLPDKNGTAVVEFEEGEAFILISMSDFIKQLPSSRTLTIAVSLMEDGLSAEFRCRTPKR